MTPDDRKSFAAIHALAGQYLETMRSAPAVFSSAGDVADMRALASVVSLATAGLDGTADPDEVAALRSMTSILDRADFAKPAVGSYASAPNSGHMHDEHGRRLLTPTQQAALDAEVDSLKQYLVTPLPLRSAKK